MSKVLIVEDEPALLDCYVELANDLGHEALAADHGDDALAIARAQRPDLVITDYMLPGKSGADLMRALAADALLGAIPVILLSAGRPPESVQRLAWRFYEKPIHVDRFRMMIDEALKARGQTAPASPLVSAPQNDLGLMREEMLSWVSHEIRSPLAAATMATHMALRALDDGKLDARELERRIQAIGRQLSRMDELVTAILDAAQLNDGKLKLTLDDMEVGTWLREVADFWRELHPDFIITLRVVDGACVRADRERLRQIIDNLISNAIKYGGASKEVTLDVQVEPTRVAISVTDRGRGIPNDELPHIFNRFHRVPGQGGRGHGLGLYIAAALARLHAGRIDVKSEIDVGTTFTLVLPRGAGIA